MSDYRQIAARFRNFGKQVSDNMAARMQETGEAIAESMQAHLLENNSIDTGALYDSIRAETKRDSGVITTRVIADAQNEDGVEYAEFVEFGTGIYNEHGDGRDTPWRYQDRDGNWHTTRGNRAKPFIRPAFSEHEAELNRNMRRTLQIEEGVK